MNIKKGTNEGEITFENLKVSYKLETVARATLYQRPFIQYLPYGCCL